jgi:hypothetical protein
MLLQPRELLNMNAIIDAQNTYRYEVTIFYTTGFKHIFQTKTLKRAEFVCKKSAKAFGASWSIRDLMIAQES